MTALIAVGVIIAIVAIVTVAFFIPNKKYKNAEKLLKNQKYTQAVTEFKDLGGFRKSKEFLAEAYYNIGLQALNEKDEDKASDYFKRRVTMLTRAQNMASRQVLSLIITQQQMH